MKITKTDNIEWDKMGVYVFENINGKKYIGSTNNIKRRFNSHCSMLRNNNHTGYFQNAYNKKDSMFTFSILEYVEDINILRQRETLHIKENECMYYQDGYNIFDVDDNGYFCHSDETKKKISDTKTGVPAKTTTKGKVVCINVLGEIMQVEKSEFDSNKNLFGINKGKTTMKNSITGETELVHINDERITTGELIGVTTGILPHNTQKIIVDGKEYESIKEAYANLNISKPTFSKIIKSKKYTISESPLILELNGYKPNNGTKVTIDGINYKSIKEASEKLNISQYKVKKMYNTVIFDEEI